MSEVSSPGKSASVCPSAAGSAFSELKEVFSTDGRSQLNQPWRPIKQFNRLSKAKRRKANFQESEKSEELLLTERSICPIVDIW